MRMSFPAEETFAGFFERWMKQLEDHLRNLITSAKEGGEPDYESVVSNITAHHKAYYAAKWAAAPEDVLAFFSPSWLSPFEKAYLWATGWKPSTTFRLVESLRQTRAPLTSLTQMSEEQVKRIEKLRARTRLEEEGVEREMERQQVAVANRKMVELARLSSRVREGDAGRSEVDRLVEAAVSGLLAGLVSVMKAADRARLKTLKGVLDVLGPRQCADFLAVFSLLQIQQRRWGSQRESLAETT
ncbi:hypothetical protein Nepgr_032310 [Nepenthes gracilis]|uniref:DOG1 domain-containing protein n=1 Tax=Nepenthes gracilis TaxID=150966 RepID=A0AAD3TKK8_NEPGR|nr:hypothetical protein Nepgr_032310 [Nepenthes gracilis]